VWDGGTLPERGGMLQREPGSEPSESGGLACQFPPGPLHIAMYYCLTGSSLRPGNYHASRLIRCLRRPDDVNSFLLRDHTLASSYGD
jgi:hypothetical protein